VLNGFLAVLEDSEAYRLLLALSRGLDDVHGRVTALPRHAQTQRQLSLV
jgi:hypothetical protein